MNKEKILKDFDALMQAKKVNATNTKLCLFFSLIVVICVLLWGAYISLTAMDKVVVVERSGEYLKTNAERRTELFAALIKNTCAQATQYANSFDRVCVKRNQAYASFYINKADLTAITNKYYNDKAYFDAVNNGAVYKCEIDSLLSFQGENEPYRVRFLSRLTVYTASGTTKKFIIESEGTIVKTTPQFPENVTGFFFNRLMQTWRLSEEKTVGNRIDDKETM
jgi:hypothetical protein